MKNGATTKGYIKNNVTGTTKSFMFNPSTFEYSRSVEYADLTAPGMPYPGTQYVKGNIRTFNIDLFLFDKPYTGKHNDYMLFLGAFLTPETSAITYTRPPDMTFCLGYFIRRCVLQDLKISIEEWDKHLNPVQTRFTLQLRQV